MGKKKGSMMERHKSRRGRWLLGLAIVGWVIAATSSDPLRQGMFNFLAWIFFIWAMIFFIRSWHINRRNTRYPQPNPWPFVGFPPPTTKPAQLDKDGNPITPPYVGKR